MFGRRYIALLAVAGLAATAPAQVSEHEQSLIDRIDRENALRQTRRFSEEIVSNRSGAGAGTAVAGSPDERKLAQAIAATFRELGLSVEEQTFPVRAYSYDPPELTVNGERFDTVILHTTPGTYGERDGREFHLGHEAGGEVLRLELVDVGLGTRADYDEIGSVEGKAVLVHRDDDVTGWPSTTLAEAAFRGARAAIFYGVAGDTPLPNAIKQESVQYQEEIPALSIRRTDAARIRELLENGPVEVTLRARMSVENGTSLNVIGRLEGSTYPDESIVFGGHFDRWFTGAQDDSVGIGMLLELARLFATGPPPRRTFYFIGWGAEEAGGIATQADWLTGSYAFVRDRGHVVDHTALYFNLDGGGWSNEKGTVFGSPEITPFLTTLVHDLDLGDRLTVQGGISTWIDAWCFGGIRGASSAYIQWRRGYLGGQEEIPFLDYYHTDLDRFDEKLLANLGHDLRIVAAAAFRMDRMERLPFDFTATARWLRSALEEDKARLPDLELDGILRAIEALEARAEEAGPGLDNRHRLELRSRLYPELVSAGGYVGSLRTRALVNRVAGLRRAEEALESARLDEARESLEALLFVARHLSREPYLDSRKRDREMVSWNAERGQLPPPLPEKVYDALSLLGDPTGANVELAKEWVRGALIESELRLEMTLAHLESVVRLAEATLRDAVYWSDSGS